MADAAIAAFRSHEAPTPALIPTTTAWPSLTEAIQAWVGGNTAPSSTHGDLLVSVTSIADPANPWLVRFASALHSTAPARSETNEFRWACAAADAARNALRKGWTTPEELETDLRAALRIAQWLATTVEDAGDEWIIRGLRGTPPLPGILPVFRGEPWGQFYHFVSHELPTPRHRRGDESVDRHVMTLRVAKDEVTLADDARRMPLVLASLSALDTDVGRVRDSHAAQPPAVVVDAPLAAGAWCGNVFVLCDEPGMIQIQKGPFQAANA